MNDRPIRTLRQRVVYENDYATVFDDEVSFPSGRVGTYFRTRWKAPHGVAILPVQKDRFLLIRTYRYQDQSYSLEIPQGFGTSNSSPLEDANRELFEETGLKAERLKLLLKVGGDFVTHVFVGIISEASIPDITHQEDSEVIEGIQSLAISTFSLAEAERANIHDSVTLAAMFAYKQSVNEGFSGE